MLPWMLEFTLFRLLLIKFTVIGPHIWGHCLIVSNGMPLSIYAIVWPMEIISGYWKTVCNETSPVYPTFIYLKPDILIYLKYA